MSNAMAYTCSTCGKVMASEGGMEVHQAGHAAQSTAESARAEAARRALEEAELAISAGHDRVGEPPETPGLVMVLGGVIVFLLIAGLIGAVNPSAFKQKHRSTVAAGAAPTAVSIPTPPAVPAGYRVVDEGAFSIAVPDGWVDLHPGKDDVKRMLDKAGQVNPAYAAMLTDKIRNALAQHIEFISIDQGTGDNVNVVSMGDTGRDTIDNIPVADLEKQLGSIGVVNLTHNVQQLPVGRVLVVSGQLRIGASLLPMMQYYVISGGSGYVFTFSGCTCHPAAMASTIRVH